MPLVLSKKPISFDGSGFIFVKDGNNILQKVDSRGLFFSASELSLTEEDIKQLIFIGELDENKIFALEKSGVSLEKEKTEYIKNYLFLDGLKQDELKAVFRGCQLLNWHKQSAFCGCCGGSMHMEKDEFVKICDNDSKHRYYPQYSPSMIVLVRNGDKLLLARSAHFPEGVYSTLAGFLEAGETAEEAVKREVMEEVGIKVTNVRSVTTAPWPFPNSLMLAFEADAETIELKLDEKEIQDAKWFKYNELPKLPIKSSIAYELIQNGVTHCEKIYKLQNNRLTLNNNLFSKGLLLTTSGYTANTLNEIKPIFSFKSVPCYKNLLISQCSLLLLYNELFRWQQSKLNLQDKKPDIKNQATSSFFTGGIIGLAFYMAIKKSKPGLAAVLSYEQACIALSVLCVYPSIKKQEDGFQSSIKSILKTTALYSALSFPVALMYGFKKNDTFNSSRGINANVMKNAARYLLFKTPIVVIGALALETLNEQRMKKK